MSPLLFNLVLNPLIRELVRCERGMAVNGLCIPILAFADDFILASDNEEDLQALLNRVSIFLTNLGMGPKNEHMLCLRHHLAW